MIRRRAPLRRNPTLKRHKPLNRSTTPLKRESQKGRLRRLWRKSIRRLYFEFWSECQSCGKLIDERNSDTHHKLKRSLGGHDDPSNAVVVCRRCHRLVIHGHAEMYRAVRDSEANVMNGQIVQYPEHLRHLLLG